MSPHDKEFQSYLAEDGLSEKSTAIDEIELQRRAEILRAGLEGYGLDDIDEGLLLEGRQGCVPGKTAYVKPILAVIGRPNVGKSTLVNRILGRREAVVEDVPGVTRDRVLYPAKWNAKEFVLIDTGGWEVDAAGVHTQVAEQAERAVRQADAILFVADAVVGITAMDEAIVKMLRRAHKPMLLVANKVDDERMESDAAALWGLGVGKPYPVSSLHGRGTADMLDAAVAMFAASPDTGIEYGPMLRSVALVGRPNVGKSSLLNKLAGQVRAVVDNHPGTTRDPVDEVIELGGVSWRFVDTAGIRRKVHLQRGSDYYASLRTQLALERAEVALVLLEADKEVSEQDVRVVQKVLEAGRALVLVFNKWDLLESENRNLLEKSIERDLGHVSWAPRVNISAHTGWHKDKLPAALETALAGWDTRVSTGRLNAFLGEFMAAHPHPLRGGKQPRILFGTQASAQPPKVVLFTTGFLDAGYRRFLVRRLRETFSFQGTPVEISMRIRQKRPNKNGGIGSRD